MWKIERDEEYFRIFDSKKDIAGYFDPDYGELFPKEKELELIDQMHKNQDKIPGGFLMVPMVKFKIFDDDIEEKIEDLEKKLDTVKLRITHWKNFLLENKNEFHSIRVSHTDQDMLSITFPIKFDIPLSLEKKALLEKLKSTLDLLQKQGLL
jgi:chaperonin cofactor prefoldin